VNVRIAPSGRRHFPLVVDAPLSDFAAIASTIQRTGSMRRKR